MCAYNYFFVKTNDHSPGITDTSSKTHTYILGIEFSYRLIKHSMSVLSIKIRILMLIGFRSSSTIE